jgi:hypothetical protein
MIPILLTLNLLCPNYVFINKTDEWNDLDKKTLSRSHQICYTKFNKGCIAKFIKRKANTYWLICRRGNAD